MTGLIEGMRVTPLRRIPDERGAVFHMLRCDSEGFEHFLERRRNSRLAKRVEMASVARRFAIR